MIGVFVLSGAQLTLVPQIIELLAQRNATEVVVFGLSGGLIGHAWHCPGDRLPFTEF